MVKISTLTNKEKKSCDFLNFCIMDTKRLPAYNTVIERFISNLRVDFSNTIRTLSQFKIKSTQNIEFEKYKSSIKESSFISILNLESFHAPAMINIDQELGFSIIDTVLGGELRPLIKNKKEITNIDLTIIEEIFDIIINNLNSAWKPVYDIRATYKRSETNPTFVGIIHPNDNILLTEIEVTFSKAVGSMQIAIPMKSIFSIRDELI